MEYARKMSVLKSLTIPEELLDLKDVKIIESVLTRENEIIIRVESTKKEIPCHRCGDACAAPVILS